MRLEIRISHTLTRLFKQGMAKSGVSAHAAALLPEITEATERFVSEYRGRQIAPEIPGVLRLSCTLSHGNEATMPDCGPLRKTRTGYSVQVRLWRADLYHLEAGIERAAPDVFATLEDRLETVQARLRTLSQR